MFLIGLTKREKAYVTNSKFERCVAESGGAIYLDEVQLLAETNTFSHNKAVFETTDTTGRRL